MSTIIGKRRFVVTMRVVSHRLLMGCLLLVFLLVNCAAATSRGTSTPKAPTSSHVLSYDEPTVWRFVAEAAANSQLSAPCARALHKLVPFLTANATLDAQRASFSASFAHGQTHQVASRDFDRWFYRSLDCLSVAGETRYSASENPVSYCYATSPTPTDDAYAICVPTVCVDDRVMLLREWQTTVIRKTTSTSMRSSLNASNELTEQSATCMRSRFPQQWYQHSWPILHFSIDFVLSTLVLAATVYDFKTDGQPRDVAGESLFAFSYTRNMKQLLRMPKDSASMITCMFGLRFLALCWTLVGHSFYVLQSFLDNADEFRFDLVNNFWAQIITNFTLSTDVFLTLSGTLTAFSWFKRLATATANGTTRELVSWRSWLRFYRHRLVRLLPALFYTLFTLVARLSYTHFHAMWGPTDTAAQCRESSNWMKNALLINSLSGSLCMPWTWYISCEFIFYLLAPIYMMTLWRRPRLGLLVAMITIVASIYMNWYTMVVYNFPPTPLTWSTSSLFSDDFLAYHFKLYIKPWHRMGPYIVGLLLGYVLAKAGDEKQDVAQIEKSKSQRSAVRRAACWTAAAGGAFWTLFGLWPALQSYDWPIYHLVYGATHRTVFSLTLAWLIYACHTNSARALNWLLSARIFLPLSSLTYSVYLIHIVAIGFTFLSEHFPMHYTGFGPLFLHCGAQLVVSYAMGARTALVAELPAIKLESALLRSRRTATPTAASDDSKLLKTDSECDPLHNEHLKS